MRYTWKMMAWHAKCCIQLKKKAKIQDLSALLSKFFFFLIWLNVSLTKNLGWFAEFLIETCIKRARKTCELWARHWKVSNLIPSCMIYSNKLYPVCIIHISGLWDWYWRHFWKEGIEEEASVQDVPLVPCQHLPGDEDVQRHHRIWSSKTSLSSLSDIQFHLYN